MSSTAKTVPFVAHDLANSATGEVWTIAGSEDHGDHGIALYYGDDERGYDTIPPRDLLHPATKAVCSHGYAANDSCPGCDAEHDDLHATISEYGTQISEHIGQPIGSSSIELGMIYRHADCTWSAMTPTGVVIGTNIVSADSAFRALRLDHKIRTWFTALNDNVMHDARKLDENTIRDYSMDAAVRLIRACGITTGEKFMARAAAIDEADRVRTEFESAVSDGKGVDFSYVRSGTHMVEEMQHADYIGGRTHTLEDSIAEIARVSANYPDGINYVGDCRGHDNGGKVLDYCAGECIDRVPALTEDQVIPNVPTANAVRVVMDDQAFVDDLSARSLAHRQRCVRAWLDNHAPVVPVEHDGSTL